MIEPRLPGAVEFAVAAERLGVDSVWIPEVWGYDALTGLAYLAAKTTTLRLGTFVVQLGSRSPAMLATSALSLQELSDGRFLLGIGTSGPRVMEGWHGVRFRKPVETTRETIEIVRIVSRGERLEHPGEIYPLPLPDSSGAALMPLVRPRHVPIYVAAMGPRNLRLTGAMADGWLGNAFMPETAEVFLGPLREGAELAGRSLADVDLVAPVAVEFHDDDASAAAAARKHADGYAFTIGAMGAGGRLLQRRIHQTGLRRAGGCRRRTVAGREARRSPRGGAARSRPARRSCWYTAGHHDRVHKYRAAGITTLLAKLEGDYPDQLVTLERLLDTVNNA